MKLSKNNLILLLILSLAFIIRIAGINWGFPATLHSDESVTIRSAIGMRFGNLNPNHFDWPSFYFYINYFFFWIFIKLRVQFQLIFGVEFLKNTFPFWWGPDLPFYFIGRFISAVFSTLTGFIIFKISKYIFKEFKYQILCVIIYAVSFYSIYYSYYALPDNALTFFVSLTVLLSLKILKDNKILNYLLAGSAVGLAMSTKYHGVLASISVISAHLISGFNIKRLFCYKLIIAGIFCIIAFLLTTPYALLDFELFSNTKDATGAFWQFSHMGKALNWNYYIFESLPKSVTLLGVFLGFIGIFFSFKRKNKYIKIVSIQFLFLLSYIGTWGITRPHYSLPLIPLLCLLLVYGIYELKIKFNKSWFLPIVILLLVLRPIIDITYEIICRNNTDTRIVAGNWIKNNIPKTSTILLEGNPTKYYGGDNPIFDWESYKTVNIKDPIYNLKNSTGAYAIENDKTNRKNFSDLPSSNCVIFEGKFRTGPDILICKN